MDTKSSSSAETAPAGTAPAGTVPAGTVPAGTAASDPLLSTVRSILLAEMQEHVRQLEQRIAALQEHATFYEHDQQEQWAGLQAELSALEQLAQANRQLNQATQAELEALQQAALTDPETISTRLTPMMTQLIRRTIHESHDEMAEALGPVMGEAVRVQIRDSRQEMVDALYPIIGETVQKAIGEFARELQHNIDVRLKAAIGPQGLLRTFTARLRGVSAAELTLRQAMPFQISQVFVIQHHTGLLIAHSHHLTSEEADSDLISGMLTAIRSFVRDAFATPGQDENRELDEVQYGDERIIIQSGKYAYVAAVVRGVEPEGFHARLHQLVADLHVRLGNSLRDYDGDPDSLPNIQLLLAQWIGEVSGEGPPRQQPRQRLALAGIGLFLILGVLLACFYIWFTARLLPTALAQTPTASATFTATLTATLTPTASPTPTFTLTPTSTATATPLPTFTDTPLPTLTPTYRVVEGYMIGNAWTREEPRLLARRGQLVLARTPVQILAVYDTWGLIQWANERGTQRGWVLMQWVSALEPLPPDIITPTP